MIDLTPLDVRKKRGDFGRSLRGYDPAEVDHFLEMVADRLEEVVRENLTLRERAERLGAQVEDQGGRERAVQEALVTAQELREEIRAQAHREAGLVRREAEADAHGVREEVERFLQERRRDLQELARARTRFLKGFRTILERQLDAVEAEEANPPAVDFELPPPPSSKVRAPAPEEPIPLDALLESDEEREEEPDPDFDPGIEPGADLDEDSVETDPTGPVWEVEWGEER